ncbi:MAG: hypothetical protein A3C84_00065 [Candidatus Ryanbacteria bacterium RIFCSPHIGHO2_02_FULL_48_12]|uniref:Glycosyltransferase 2-like domain-containing protein n=1 Tax=Candidatus Ryanbacteria bacterium RIFCSPHIGHO2_01_FULL_48_27 TaxID=1802115 RepID=A0A1G2G5C5_9BACT|nr:MAG: hypothetical protein A2756_00405 [Candidatus Ryanbacteria bacterium RIFCSPHIGHO2_01_FULL_48_27]OGZ50498.1 MAG: hypothetical protein A3C84_00065 [Candidatus Ryanbacteria bacterium RIFCSPHIGHO2_02_FULL_48_12]
MDTRQKITNGPLVSIILPTWNRVRFLQSAIDGILEQTYQNFELLVLDDGSTDETPEIMRQIMAEKNDPRIRYIQLETHQGGAQARNIGIRQARGEFIASQDDDDEWDPQYLEKQVSNLSALPKTYGMSYVSYWRVLTSGKKILMPPRNVRPKSGNIYGGDIMRKNYNPYQTALIRKSVLEDVGLINEEMNSLYDWEMWLRIAKKYQIAHIDEPLFTQNSTPGSNSTDPKKIWWRIDARKLILRDFGDDIKKFGYFPDHCSALADLLVAAGDSAQARAYLWQGIRTKPAKLKLWLKLIASYFGKSAYQQLLTLRRNTLLKKISLR